jgi:hypothetical protein
MVNDQGGVVIVDATSAWANRQAFYSGSVGRQDVEDAELLLWRIRYGK